MILQNSKSDTKDRAVSKNGSTLVIVVCVSAFLTAFALAMFYTAEIGRAHV